MVYLAIIIGLSIAVFFLLIKLILLIKEIKNIKNQIHDSNKEYVSVNFIGHNLEELASTINEMIDEKESALIEGGKNHRILQQSIANISHDMRTPLTSVIGYIQLAIKNCNDEKQLSDLNVALERARYCNQLIDDFYELSVAEARDKLPKIERIDLSALLCDQILGNYVAFESSGLKPEFLNSDKQVWVMADKIMLTRIIQNLISNALKYAVDSLKFKVEDNDSNSIKLIVSNPVKQNNINTEMIFQKFYQNDLSRGNSGSGIGLYLCRCFVEKMGGSINAECKRGILKINVILKKSKHNKNAAI